MVEEGGTIVICSVSVLLLADGEISFLRPNCTVYVNNIFSTRASHNAGSVDWSYHKVVFCGHGSYSIEE